MDLCLRIDFLCSSLHAFFHDGKCHLEASSDGRYLWSFHPHLFKSPGVTRWKLKMLTAHYFFPSSDGGCRGFVCFALQVLGPTYVEAGSMYDLLQQP